MEILSACTICRRSCAEKLKVVGRAGVGIDNVDLQTVTELGCLVMNAPTMNTIVAAEHGIALLTSMARNVTQADASIKARKWLRTKYVGVSLVGKTLAIMGFGKVGSWSTSHSAGRMKCTQNYSYRLKAKKIAKKKKTYSLEIWRIHSSIHHLVLFQRVSSEILADCVKQNNAPTTLSS
ncbi:D-3-phosphoglycerate dehydrogenase [Perilla frutescens var. hirtella]|nr:D-3-phosphoglycerate dehydrogenase [Perilla frutescens var. hirtella]